MSRVVVNRVLCAVVAIAVAGPAAAQTREGRVHVSVTGSDGKLLAIGAGDVSVSEDGRTREVLRVEKASGPVQIALLVDDSQAAQTAVQDMRIGLKRFVERMLAANPDTHIAIITFGERPTLVTDYTNSKATLDRGINRVFARQGAGAYMLEAIVNATRGITRRPEARSHIVVVGTEGLEFSNDHYERVLDHLAESGATLWSLTLTSGERAGESDEVRNRKLVLGRGTSQSGGRDHMVLANSAIPQRLDAVADDILNQQVIVYGRPETLVPAAKIEVKVTKPGVKLLAPSTLPRPRKQ